MTDTTTRASATANICNTRGLHARASAKFVKTASAFEADIRVTRDGVTAVLRVSPLTVGNNTVTVRFEPVPDFRRVRLRFSMPPDYRMESTAFPLGPGLYAVVGNQLHGPGRIDVAVVAERADGTELAFPFRLEVPLPGR